MRESDIQRAIVDYVRAVAPDALIYAIPNAARRTAGGKAGNAVPGLLAGMPDLGMVLADGRAAFIEVKTEAGRLSEAQNEIGHFLLSNRAGYCIARSVDDARQALKAWGVKTREVR